MVTLGGIGGADLQENKCQRIERTRPGRLSCPATVSYQTPTHRLMQRLKPRTTRILVGCIRQSFFSLSLFFRWGREREKRRIWAGKGLTWSKAHRGNRDAAPGNAGVRQGWNVPVCVRVRESTRECSSLTPVSRQSASAYSVRARGAAAVLGS